MKRKFILLSAVVSLFVLAGFGVPATEDDSGLIGQPVPEFSVPGFDGQELHSSVLSNKVGMVVFWFPT